LLQLNNRKEHYKKLKMNRVTDVQLAASRTRPEQIERKYVRPEDTMNTGEEFSLYMV
jgi:hypothetical protein